MMKALTRILVALGTVGLAVLGAGTAVTSTAAWVDTVVATSAASSGSWVPANEPSTRPFSPGNDVTSIAPPTWTIPESNGGTICAELTITSTSSDPAPWSVVIAVDEAPYWNLTASSFWGNGMTFAADPDDPARVIVTGHETLAQGQAFTATICAYTDQAPPPADSTWYSVTTSASGEWSATQACVTITITGRKNLADYPFFYGWQGSLDLSGAKAAMQAAGGTPTHVSWNPQPSGGYWFTTDPATDNPVADVYALTSGKMTAIRGTQSVTITACVNGHMVQNEVQNDVTDDTVDPAEVGADDANGTSVATNGAMTEKSGRATSERRVLRSSGGAARDRGVRTPRRREPRSRGGSQRAPRWS